MARFIGNENVKFGIMNMMPYRKKTCLVILKDDIYTKVASFNNEESAELFMQYVADMFNIRRKEE